MSGPDIKGGDNAQTVAAGQLRALIERRERLDEDKQAISDDTKELHKEVKSAGFDLRTFNEMVKLRKLDKAERDEREALRDLYGSALGCFS
ncbi:DUF2312 domain-containing protein [Mesorhizobium sp. ESP7-2]|uniref:DUF2312 domain-containing protein n=1 Tax=Mesorhizobium sp. ESP7-2 TaxID=2876622 RepID=UPI001CC96203|nr:DUF2312 domain-containing protein [Mesorhizobium sp. ESP7-2]MBZ9706108.1 DUF2312 domain-containing protein [Mesorhizobium sp. ESP7-2]